MRKLFLKSITLLFMLVMSINTAWAQGIGGLIGGIDPENPATWFYVNLTAQPSTPACGTNPGLVWLRSVTPSGEDSNPYVLPDKPANPYAFKGTEDWDYRQWSEEYGFSDGMNDAKAGLTEKNYRSHYNDEGWTNAVKEGYDAGWNWYKSGHYLNPVNPVGFAASASLKGYTVVYAPGFEDLMGYSSYAYFYGKAQENDGWYFTGWSYTDGDSDLGVGDENGVLFRVLPAATAGETNIRNEYVYATFKPVMVSDYKVNGLINKSVSNTTTVVFDAVGQSVSASDFTVDVPEANFSAAITSCENNKVTVTVTYSGSTNGEFRGNVTLASMSGCSQLTAAVYARVGADAANEATLYDGKAPTATSGTLEAMIAAANGTNKIVVLNKNYESNLSVNANVTLNFNGYTVQDLTVAGGEVTIAYDKYGSNGEAVSVTGGKLILNGGEFSSLQISNGATVEQNGATITGAATNNGTLVATEGRFEGGLTSAGTLTVNGGAFEGATAITVNGGTAIFNKAAISATTTGILVSGGETTISSKLVSVYGRTNAVKQTAGSITLLNGKFAGETAPLAGTINLQAGYFKVDGENIGIAVPEGKKVLNVLAGTEFAEGYRYFIGEDATGVGVCRIGTTSYATLEAALAYANNKPDEDVVIIMTNDYTLPAGYYTLPARATLIVPMSDEQETGYEIVNRVSNNSATPTSYVQPFEFRRLTFAYGVNMDVHGTIELSGTQRASDDGYAAMPHGAYGHLVMEEGSHMTLQNGSLLRAWGFMTGKGETDARRGSKVREQFQMGDWKGGSISFSMLADDRHVFPITQYFIQNVESPVKYHPGALLSTTTSVSANFGSMGITAMANDIVIVGVSGGDPAMFFMDQEADAENTWVRKWYDAEHDIQTYDVNSGAHIGSMVLDLGKLGTQPLVMNSATFVLPITNNMKIHLLSGQMDFTQTTALLPGAEVEVDKESTVTIYTNSNDLSTLSSFESSYRSYLSAHEDWEAAKANHDAWVANGSDGDEPELGEEPTAPEKPILSTGELFVYDADEWDNYAKGKGDAGKKYTKVVKYSPSWDGALVSGKPADGKPNVRSETTKPGDATINVHGAFNTGDGAVYTTAGGANIFSSNEDAGSFIVNRPTPTYTAKIYQVKNASASSYESTEAVSAKLKNGAGAAEAYTATAGTGTNLAFLYRDNAWQAPVKDSIMTFYFDCYTAEVDMDAYAEDVAAKANNIAICHAPNNIAECLAGMALAKQAWSMNLTPQQYEAMKSMISEENMATIQEQVASMKEAGYDLGGAVQHIYIKPQEWLEIASQAHIKLDFDQDYIDELEANYNAGNYADAVNAYMEYVEAQAYNPYLEGVEGNADHTYSDADGAGRLFIKMDNCQWWEVEKKDNLYHCIHPNNDTYYEWAADEWGIESWQEKRFKITWKNWNGDTIQTADAEGNPQDAYSVTYGTMAEFLGTNPTREKTIDYTYDFTGWSPALGKVTSDVTYTATYDQKPRMYTIVFQNEGGVEIERQFLTHNEVPVCENVPTKVGHTLEWNPAIAAVVGDATYTATWLEEPPTEYEVTFFDYNGTTVLQQSNVAVGALPTPPADPAGKPASASGEFTYVFDHWSPALEEVSATSIKSYTAVYREEAVTYTVVFLKENSDPENYTESDIIESHEYAYGETPVCSATPTKPATAAETYTFAWDPQIETVRGAATYKAVFTPVTNRYTVTLKANPSGACTFTGAGTFDYNTTVNNVTVSYDEDQYEFQGWSDLTGDAKKTTTHAAFTLTEDITIVADFRYKGDDKVTITWKNWNGGDLGTSEPKVNAATTFIGAIPTREASESRTYTFYGWSTQVGTEENEWNYGTIYKNGLTPKATANTTYYAYFSETPRKYTISWKNEAGTADIEVDYEQPYGATIEYNSATPTKNADADYSYTFDGWSATQGGAVVSLPATVSGDAAFYAHFSKTPVLPTDLILGASGSADLANADVKKNDLVITSNGINSSELKGADHLTLTGEAIFRLEKIFAAETWYAVAVPWKVDVKTGIYAGGKRLAVGDIFVIGFDANAYASADRENGRNGYWKFLDKTGESMQPGKLYMIWLKSAQSAVEFHKKAGETIWNTTTSVSTTGGSSHQDNWNAIANPALYHASLNTGSEDVLRYNGNDSYIPGSTANMIVGEPVFVQVATEKSVVTAQIGGASPAPYRRAPETATEADNRFVVELSLAGQLNDRMIVQTAEEKANEYVIGKDLAKMGVSALNAQMWINRYDAKLCKNTLALQGESVEYPLNISAPAAGEYILSASQERGNATLYLTFNGEAIWNLSESDYVLHLETGIVANYGLRVSAKAPQVATGIDEAVVDAQGETKKVLINNQVFIIRGEKVYTIDGQMVK